MASWYVIRADANNEIGIGHVMRCLALAEWLSDFQLVPVLITRFPNKFIESKLDALQGRLFVLPDCLSSSSTQYAHSNWLNCSEEEDADSSIEIISMVREELLKGMPEFVLVDHYSIGAPWEEKLSQIAPVFVLDDLNDRMHHCNWLVDQTLNKSFGSYRGLVPDTARLFIGSEFALLRKEFYFAAEKQGEGIISSNPRILVSMGGGDVKSISKVIIDYLLEYCAVVDLNFQISVLISSANRNVEDYLRLQSMHGNIEVIFDANNVAELMSVHDLCIGAAGTASYERCAMGMPSIAIIVADNQVGNARALEAAGAAICMTIEDVLSRVVFFEALKHMLENKPLLGQMGQAAAALCDGSGGQKISQEIVSDLSILHLRKATLSDLEIVFDWQCNSKTRMFFNNPAPPSFEEHDNWFRNTLNNERVSYYLIWKGSKRVGTVRLDFKSVSAATVSILISPSEYGKGYAKKAMIILLSKYSSFNIEAQVKQGNKASHKLFKSLGFLAIGSDRYVKYGEEV